MNNDLRALVARAHGYDEEGTALDAQRETIARLRAELDAVRRGLREAVQVAEEVADKAARAAADEPVVLISARAWRQIAALVGEAGER